MVIKLQNNFIIITDVTYSLRHNCSSEEINNTWERTRAIFYKDIACAKCSAEIPAKVRFIYKLWAWNNSIELSNDY